MSRINFVIAIIGRRGAGKSVYTRELLEGYRQHHPGKKILIISDENPNYADIVKVTPDMLPRWTGAGIYRVWDPDTDVLILATEKSMYNSLVIYEDASKFIKKNLQPAVRRMILDSKQRNNDIIFQFHGFSYVPPEMFRVLDMLTLFKINDTPEYRKADIPAFDEVDKTYREVMRDKNPYAKKTVKIY